MTNQGRAGARLLTRQVCEVKDPSDQPKKSKRVQHEERMKIYISEITSREFRKAYRDR